MIDIKPGDTFRSINKKNELYDLEVYRKRLASGQSLENLEGWNNTTEFLPPVTRDGLSLPALTQDIAPELIAWLEVGSEFSVVQVLYHCNAASNGKAYQCLLVEATVSIDSTPTLKRGFLWSVHGGNNFIEQIVKDPPPTTPVPATPQTGTEITVYAGQTLVLELKTTGKVDDGKKDDAEKKDIGSIEVELVDTEGKPYTQAELVHLIGEQGIYTVPINQATGKGTKTGIKAGTYDLALLLGTVYFASDEAGLSQAASQELEKVRSKLVNAGSLDFNKLKCVGYADSAGSQTHNDNLCLKRALSVKEQLSKIQEKVKYIDTGLGGMLPGSDEEVKKKNRKVDVFGLIK